MIKIWWIGSDNNQLKEQSFCMSVAYLQLLQFVWYIPANIFGQSCVKTLSFNGQPNAEDTPIVHYPEPGGFSEWSAFM